ncbi:MAG: hypothetical protein WC760_10350 [Bacteroidia bacterium]|jgi:hypothetical protein
MKKLLFVLGILAAQCMLAGTLFKIMHWPGASLFLIAGAAGFCFAFLPLALRLSYLEHANYLWLHLVTYLVFALGVSSIVFKVLHWNGAQMLLQIAFPLPFVLFLPVYLYQTRMDKKLNNTSFIGVLAGLTFIAVFSVLLSLNAG